MESIEKIKELTDLYHETGLTAHLMKTLYGNSYLSHQQVFALMNGALDGDTTAMETIIEDRTATIDQAAMNLRCDYNLLLSVLLQVTSGIKIDDNLHVVLIEAITGICKVAQPALFLPSLYVIEQRDLEITSEHDSATHVFEFIDSSLANGYLMGDLEKGVYDKLRAKLEAIKAASSHS